MSTPRISVPVSEVERVGIAALIKAGASEANAALAARAIARAEGEGNSICGLYYLPVFCEHLQCGKVDGAAEPLVETDGATVTVDARNGFAHPAIEAGAPALADATKRLGIAAMAVRNSYNCLAQSHHVTPLAEQGLIGVCVSNAPAFVAPPGGKASIFGTNPIAYAVPMPGDEMIVADQSMSAVTKTAMIMLGQSGEAIPLGWAQDGDGQPTTSAEAGLAGALLPSGGQKGANPALLIEILAASLTGSKLSTDAGAFGGTEGGPPGVGQFLLAIDPQRFGGSFEESLGRLAESFASSGARLPGRRMVASLGDWRDRSVDLDAALWQRSVALAS